MGIALLQSSPGLPTIEGLSFQAILVIRDVQARAGSSVVDPPIMSSHSHLLLYFYRKFMLGSENGQPAMTALEQA